VIHVPSTQSLIFAAINRPESVGADVRALLFAIYFAAATVLLSDDTQKEAVIADLQRFKQGMEISLYHAEFLEAPTITSLQAMVIYQVRDFCFYVAFISHCDTRSFLLSRHVSDSAIVVDQLGHYTA
jgi:hypothetical protein